MPPIRLQFVGDVILTRKGSPEVPFSRLSQTLQGADVSFFNNESPYARAGSPHIYGAVAHDPECMAALSHAGFHACTVANNHCMGWGADAMLECADRLRKMDIAVCGVGANDREATAPAVIERRGVRLGFLGYNCIGPKGYMAEPDKAGCAMVRVHTHYEPYEYTPGAPPLVVTRAYAHDLHAMGENIRRVKASTDFLAVYFHWGLHYSKSMICDYQFEVGHVAIDAGADAVLGCGPHMLKGVEVYMGAPIFYSLGNFCTTHPTPKDRKEDFAEGRINRSVTDMIQRAYTHTPQEGARNVIACLALSEKGKIERVSYRPVMLDHAGTPELFPPGSPQGNEVIEYLAALTKEAGLDTRFQRDGDEVTVTAGAKPWTPPPVPMVPQ